MAPKVKQYVVGAAVFGGALLLFSAGTEDRPADPSTCRVSVTADMLNVRAEPVATAAIVGKIRQGGESDAEKVVQGGFRKLVENRWVATEFATPMAGRDCG